MTVERLSWASGPCVVDGWHHSDIEWWPGMLTNHPDHPGHQPGRGAPDDARDHIGPIQEGLPWADATFDYCVSMHGLMMLPEPDLVPALVELRRVTKPGGWLRVSVPDMDQAIYAYLHGNRGWFPLEAPNAGVAFCRYVTQNGATRSVFTQPRLAHLLADAGWRQWVPSACHLSSSGIPGITELDSRPDESIFMEARKP